MEWLKEHPAVMLLCILALLITISSAVWASAKRVPQSKELLNHIRFPRLFDLAEFARKKGRGVFFENLPQALSHQLGNEFYKSIEDDLQALDESAWKYFREAILKDLPESDQTESARSYVFDRLSEIKGYIVLKQKGYENVRFIPRSKKQGEETPDVEAVNAEGSPIALLEVKRLRQSDNENQFRENNTALIKNGHLPKIRRLNHDVPNGLQNKLKQKVNDAVDQMYAFHSSETDCERFVLLVIDLDHEQRIMPGIKNDIDLFIQSLPASNKVKVECEYVGFTFD